MNTKNPTVTCHANMSSYIECVIEEIQQLIIYANVIMQIDNGRVYNTGFISENFNRIIKQLTYYIEGYFKINRLGGSTDFALIKIRDKVYELLTLSLNGFRDALIKLSIPYKIYERRIENNDPVLDLIIDINKEFKRINNMTFKENAIEANNNFEAIMQTSIRQSEILPVATSPTIASARIIETSPQRITRLAPVASYRSFEARRRNSKTRAKKASRYHKIERRTINRSKKKKYPKGIKI